MEELPSSSSIPPFPELVASHTLPNPASSLALSPDGSRVAVAGREMLRTVTLGGGGDGEMAEDLNLLSGNTRRLPQHAPLDVAWHPLQASVFATGHAVNGAVVLWDTEQKGSDKLTRTLSGHSGAVNRLAFHPTEGTRLLSGSRDRSAKLWDTRQKSAKLSFAAAAEVRDVQFSRQAPARFAAALENGVVQLFDVRVNREALLSFHAHQKAVSCLDFHPERAGLLVTGSQDMLLRVWELEPGLFRDEKEGVTRRPSSGRGSLADVPRSAHAVQTTAPVARVAWRPGTDASARLHVASCAHPPALGAADAKLHVWDVLRPAIPLYSLAAHTDALSAFAFLPPPLAAAGEALVTTGRDRQLLRHSLAHAPPPYEHVSPTAIAWAAADALAVVSNAPFARLRDAHAAGAAAVAVVSAQLAAQDPSAAAAASDAAAATAGTAGALSVLPAAAMQHTSFESVAAEEPMAPLTPLHMPLGASAVAAPPPLLLPAAVGGIAAERRPTPPSSLGGGGREKVRCFTPAGKPISLPAGAVALDFAYAIHTSIGNSFYAAKVNGRLVANRYALRDGDTVEIIARDGATPRAEWEHIVATKTARQEVRKNLRRAEERRAEIRGTLDDEGEVPPPPPPPDAGFGFGGAARLARLAKAYKLSGAPPAELCEQNAAAAEAADAPQLALAWRTAAVMAMAPPPETATGPITPVGGIDALVAPVLVSLLNHHAARGDPQTCASLVLVLRPRLVPSALAAGRALRFVVAYVELLRRLQLFALSAHVLKQCDDDVLRDVSRVLPTSLLSTTINVAVKVHKADRNPSRDEPPKRRPPCAVCNTAVRGLYVWCQGCGHGGHLEHLRGWFANHTECPAGCGHQCQLRPVNESLCMPVPAASDVPPGFRDTSIVQA